MAATHSVTELVLVTSCWFDFGERLMLVFYSFLFIPLSCLLMLHALCFLSTPLPPPLFYGDLNQEYTSLSLGALVGGVLLPVLLTNRSALSLPVFPFSAVFLFLMLLVLFILYFWLTRVASLRIHLFSLQASSPLCFSYPCPQELPRFSYIWPTPVSL